MTNRKSILSNLSSSMFASEKRFEAYIGPNSDYSVSPFLTYDSRPRGLPSRIESQPTSGGSYDIIDSLLNSKGPSPVKQSSAVLNKWKLFEDSPDSKQQFFPQPIKEQPENWITQPQRMNASQDLRGSKRVRNKNQTESRFSKDSLYSQANNDIADFFKIDSDPIEPQVQLTRNRKNLKTIYSLLTFTDWVEELYGKDWFAPSRNRTSQILEEEFLKGMYFQD